jgi:hypothetical protein
MHYLYLKTHAVTGVKYLGQTERDPFKYQGSGVDWKLHLAEHGKDHTTEILLQSKDKSVISNEGRRLSEQWNIVKSTEWANKIPETGGGGVSGEKNARYGKPAWNTGITLTEEQRANNNINGLKQSWGWNKGISTGYVTGGAFKKGNVPWNKGIESEEHNWYGKNHTEESIQKMCKPKEKVTCPHCNKIGGISQMKRWHYNNCKLLDIIVK